MMRKICIAILLVPTLAWAQAKSVEDLDKEAKSQFTLGEYEKAIETFKQAFPLQPNVADRVKYLYDIAQAYRLLKDCKNAQFFYKRFLQQWDDNAPLPISGDLRTNSESRLREADECVKQQERFKNQPPTNQAPDTNEKAPGDTQPGHKDAAKQTATAQPDGEGEKEDAGEEPAKAAGAFGPPHVISLRLSGGVTVVGAGDVDVPVQATFALVGGHPFIINRKLTVEAGLAATFTPVPFTAEGSAAAAMRNKTAQMWGVMADAGVTYEVAPKIGLHGDLGLGALFFAGAGESQFTMGADVSGALTMFHLRASVAADYAVTPNFFLSIPLAFSYSPPKDGLEKGIKSLTSFDIMAGVGYRM